ncbi:hypothetical protein MKY91_19615 [Alkalicoccobacillus gibsonii]|uniref:Lactococcin 972 family bacteriocin n=1 Tax=Alkalicoccobacillus gibsonii TaxID=79881 RepID=A0ABU9VP60_9BACI
MKKKLLTLSFATIFAMGSLTAFVPNESLAKESWSYGYSKSGKYNWNYYNHPTLFHWGSMTKKGIKYDGPYRKGGSVSALHLDYTGPYLVTYNKHTAK